MEERKTRPSKLTLRVMTPKGIAFEGGCDSIVLPLANDKNGERGGAIGIRPGHARAVLALSGGKIIARAGGETLAVAEIDGGLASVENDIVSVITDNARIEEA